MMPSPTPPPTPFPLRYIASSRPRVIRQLIATNCQLAEGLIDQTTTDMAQDQIARLCQQTDDANERLEKLKDGQKRQRGLEKIRKDHDKKTTKPKQPEGKSTQSSAESIKNRTGIACAVIERRDDALYF